MSGVNEEVAQVSRTSFSPMKSNEPHLHLCKGLSTRGSTGSCFSSATVGSPHFLQYHTGIGMPKCLCLEMFQSHFRPLIQFSYLERIYSGCQLIFLPYVMKSSFKSRYFMYHCFETMYSTIVPHLSWALAECCKGSIFFTAPKFCKSSTIFFLASFIVRTLKVPAL